MSTLEIPDIMIKASKECMTKPLNKPEYFKGIWLLWDNVNKEAFSEKIGISYKTCSRMYKCILEYSEKTNRELEDNDFIEIQKIYYSSGKKEWRK